MTFSLSGRVAAGMATPLLGPGIQSQRGSIFTPLPNVPLKYMGEMPTSLSTGGSSGGAGAGSGAGASGGAGDSGGVGGADEASDPNSSSSLSASGEIDPEKLEEDLEKIKKLEKEIQEKEKAQKAEEEKLKAEEEKLKKDKEAATTDAQKKNVEERTKKLEESKAKLAEDQKATKEERENFEKNIAAPFAEKDDKGVLQKDDKGNIKFLEKDSEPLNKLKQSIKDKDPTTIQNVKKALETFNEYRKANPVKEEAANEGELDTVDPTTQPQARNLRVRGPGQNTSPRLDLEYS